MVRWSKAQALEPKAKITMAKAPKPKPRSH